MNKHRLLKLADLLEKDAKNKKGIRFYMGTFGEIGDENNPLSCSTTACAMGLAVLSGAFRRTGIGYRVEGGEIDITWKGRKIGGFEAAARLFEINSKDADRLFVPHYSGHGMVREGASDERNMAAQIREYVKTGEL